MYLTPLVSFVGYLKLIRFLFKISSFFSLLRNYNGIIITKSELFFFTPTSSKNNNTLNINIDKLSKIKKGTLINV